MTYADKNTTKFNGQKDIALTGGTIIADGSKKVSNIISLAHTDGMTIHGLTVKNNVGSHVIEANASCNVTIDKCTFDGNKTAKGGEFREAVQIDFASFIGLTYASDKKSKCYDDTHCRNITVQNCTFKGFNVCFGTHTQTKSSNKHKGIYLINNTANGIAPVKGYGSAFKLMNFEDVTIEGNSISGFARGIEVTSSNRFYSTNGSIIKNKPAYITGCRNVTIQRNNFNNASGNYKASGIYVSSQFNDLIHEDIKISDNKFRLNNKASRYDIYLSYINGVSLQNNDTILEVFTDRKTAKAKT
jgi:hypothetical protein